MTKCIRSNFLFLVSLLLLHGNGHAFQTIARPQSPNQPKKSVTIMAMRNRNQEDVTTIQRRITIPTVATPSAAAAVGRKRRKTSFKLFVSNVDSSFRNDRRPRTIWRYNNNNNIIGSALQRIQSSSSLTISLPSVFKCILQYWWTLPLTLVLFPLQCLITTGSFACMPSWWPVVNLRGIFPSMFEWAIGFFLSSNVFYFASGFYLLQTSKKNTSITPQYMLESHHQRSKRMLQKMGAWIVLAGSISTIYHTVQAVWGINPWTETLAYMDHGIALTAGGYFLHRCGLPSRRVLLLGVLGLVCLTVSHSAETYAVLHSVWHLLSAMAATWWAVDGHSKRQEEDEKALRILKLLQL